MLFKIIPNIHTDDRRLVTLILDVYKLSIDEVQNGIDSCELTISGEHSNLRWILEVSEVYLGKEISILKYHSRFEMTIPTKDIIEMLKSYKKALLECG